VSASVQFTAVSHGDEVRQILELQAANLPAALTATEIANQGFVTVRHEPDVLHRMNVAAPSIVAKDGDRVVGYALVMPREFADAVPILRPLFAVLDRLSWHDTPLRANPRWFLMGQICVADGYRGVGIFDGLYRTMAEHYRDRFDFTITEVAERNRRSLRAHARVGFETVHIYPDVTTGEQWHVVALDFT
jgi:hypothetical protein